MLCPKMHTGETCLKGLLYFFFFQFSPYSAFLVCILTVVDGV